MFNVQGLEQTLYNTGIMQLLIFILVYPFLWCISILPFKLLYLLSDFIYLILYKLLGYRISTVRKNLNIALPHLSDEERKEIEIKFYHHFCDTMVEMIKTMSISEKEMAKRFTLDNIELVKEMEAKGKSVSLICAHYASYEWLLVMNKSLSIKGFGIYKKLRNRYFDRMVRKIRGRFGGVLIDSKDAIKCIKENQKKGIQGYYGMVSDQSPKLRRVNHYTKFFGAEVPVFTGAEFLAKGFDMNIMFVKGRKIKRGYYAAEFISLKKDPKDYPNFEIMDEFFALLEDQIREAPEYYLWTHKRFKHQRNTEE